MNELQQKKTVAMTQGERFAKMVCDNYGNNTSGIAQVTEFQKNLIAGYFIKIDRTLKAAEEERLRKNEKNTNHQYDNNLPVTWENTNLLDLALDCVHYARLGLDMLEDNQLFPIPYKNNKTNKYDMTMMEGYNGKRLIALKYAVDTPKSVVAELVYSKDTFRPIKKGFNSKIDTYTFEIADPFDRGEVKGGFAYIAYDDESKNKLIMMSLNDILKRKPSRASANFWGDDNRNGGWFDEMCLKTILREVYGSKNMPLDAQKVDENYQYLKSREMEYARMEVQDEIDCNANRIVIGGGATEIDTSTGEITETLEAPVKAPDKAPEF